jgi:hypothetical protein
VVGEDGRDQHRSTALRSALVWIVGLVVLIVLSNFVVVGLRGGVASGKVVRLTDHPAKDAAPTWSPDGEQIAFAIIGAAAVKKFRKVI